MKQCAHTLLTKSFEATVGKGGRIRKLVPLECWRAQGYTDEQFYKAQAVNSDSQLYRQASNGVTIPVVEAIGRNLAKAYAKGNITVDFQIQGFEAGVKQGSTSESPCNLAYYVNNQNRMERIYTYDEIGNIIAIRQGQTTLTSYEYDNLNQLVRENNKELDKTVTYSYDNGGNLLAKKEYAYTTGEISDESVNIINYGYGDSNWNDKLTDFNGEEITYDGIGNPLQYRNGLSFTWNNGRELSNIIKDEIEISYAYDYEGIRTNKTVNGVSTKYYLNGKTILREDRDNDSPLWYFYDGKGSPAGFEYYNQTYLYLKNLQGDVVQILDEEGNTVVEYVYDAWGKVESITGSLADTIGERNPIRYRSYYYDVETGLFYVGTRYYDPVVGRFINADTTDILDGGNDHILENNLYAYCFNNPINHHDPDGQYAQVIYLGYAAGASMGWNPLGWIILTVCVVATVVVGYGIYKMAKGGKQNIKDNGWIGRLSDEELNRHYNSPSTSKADKQKMKKEQKSRQQRQSSQKKKSSTKKK